VPLLASAALWGVVFVGNTVLLRVLDPVQLVVWRFWLCAAAFAALFMLNPGSQPRLPRRDWGRVLVCALLAVPVSQVPWCMASSTYRPGWRA
jgi:drug/metabolite transporter (DMT)-like permease